MGRQGETTRQQKELLALLAKDILLNRQLPTGGWWADDLTVNGKTASSLFDKGWIAPIPRETTGHRASYRITAAGRHEAERLAKAIRLSKLEFALLDKLRHGELLWRFLARGDGEWQLGGVPVVAATCHSLREAGLIRISRAGETMEKSPYQITAAGIAALEANHGDKD